MEAVIAEAPADYSSSSLYVPQVHLRYDRVVAILHWDACCDGLVAEALQGLYGNVAFSRQLLQARARKFPGILLESMDSSPNVTKGVRLAFTRMNSVLKDIVGPRHFEENFWKIQNNSVVVIVQHGHVHVFGRANKSVALLCRDSRDFVLAKTHSYSRADRRLDSEFGYHYKVKLTSGDSHLVLGTLHTTHHCAGPFSPILLTRIKAFGLQEACTQIAGRYVDYPRTFLCVALGNVDLYQGSPKEPEPTPGEHWGLTGPPSLKELDFGDDEDELSRRGNLFPLDDGRPQLPPPATTCGTFSRMPRSPSVRAFDFKNPNAAVMTCKYNLCTIVVWHVRSFFTWMDFNQSPSDGVVGTVHRASLNLIDPTDGSRSSYSMEGLELRDVISQAIARGAKHVAFPAPFSTGNDKATEIVRVVLEHVGRLSFGALEERTPEPIQVHFVLEHAEMWWDFVAATNLLSYWEKDDIWSRYEKAGLLKPKKIAPRLQLKPTGLGYHGGAD